MKNFYVKLKKFKKNFLSAFLILSLSISFLTVFNIFTFMTVAAADNDNIVSNEKARIDFSGANNTGDVKVNVLTKLDKRVKVTIEKGDKKYTYDLKNDTTPEVYPFQLGDGEYTVKVWIHAVGEKYSLALSGNYTLKLDDPLAPFLNPSQYVNYTPESKVVKKAAELIKNCTTDLDRVINIYNFVISSLVYDTQKAQTVQSGYLPSVDAIVDSGKGICFDYAAVFAAMLRSQGLPAKLVTGYVKPSNAYHAWNEVYLRDQGGWFKINEMKFDGKKFERVDPTFDSSSKSSKKVIQFIGDGTNYTKFQEY